MKERQGGSHYETGRISALCGSTLSIFTGLFVFIVGVWFRLSFLKREADINGFL